MFETQNSTSKKMEIYKKQFKDNIKILIEKGMLKEAEELINEYKEIASDDIEIYSIKGVIYISQQRYQEAEEILKEGLSIQEDFDIMYNLAYLYILQGKYDLAKNLCDQAILKTDDRESQQSLVDLYRLLGINKTKAEIIEEANFQRYYSLANEMKSKGNWSDASLYYGIAYRYCKDDELKKELEKLNSENDASKNIFYVAANNLKKRFIILSSCGWGDVYQRPHHIARSLAKFGNEVIFICPAQKAVVNSGEVSAADITNYCLNNYRVVDGVKIYFPLIVEYDGRLICNNYLDLVQNILSIPTDAYKTVVITYMPYQVEVIKQLKGDYFHIYECVDDHTDIEYAFWGQKKDVLWEQELMDRADAITTTATSLYLQRVAVEGRKNVFLLRNAVNEGDFIIDDLQMPSDLINIPEPRIVYTGVVYNRFDEKLFYEIVDSNPDKSFVIIGPVYNGMLKEKRNNLYILGPKKHSELKNYLKFMQIGIVPYIDTADIDIACDSIKQYEYIACGLPVITTYMPESAIDKIYTFLANTKDAFNEAIEKCLNLKIDKDAVSDFLLRNSWNARAALLCKIADGEMVTEQKRAVKSLGEELYRLVFQYDSPVFKILWGLYLSLEDNVEFEKIAREAYQQLKYNKYIVSKYITALIKNMNVDAIVEAVFNSVFFNNAIKEEVLFCKELGDSDLIICLASIAIGNLKEALRWIDKIGNDEVKLIYKNYINYIIGEKLEIEELKSISASSQKHPLYRYLNDIIVNQETKNNRVFIADLYDSVSLNFVRLLSLNNVAVDGFCNNDGRPKYGIKAVALEEVVEMQRHAKVKVIVCYGTDYIKLVRTLAEKGIEECEVAVILGQKVIFVKIDKELMEHIRRKDYNKTITFNKFNAADSNVHALIKYIPEEYKKKYKLNVIYGKDVWSIENIVKVPLISSVTVSGFATFLYHYPKFTYNIEVCHGGVPIKACGMMDKKDKNSGGNPQIFEKVDVVCVASELHMIINSAFYAIPENKYRITGLPRTDVLFFADSKANLEKLLGVSLEGKRVIFNMPTFRVFEQAGRIEGGAGLDDSFKINNFDYNEFNNFLKQHNLICVSKVHHGEEMTVYTKTKNRNYDSMFFITNYDLEKHDLDLYEILGAGDLLITDYSTVYNDFLFMNKPTIFVVTDIEEYRKNRGLALEPYDFWTAGPKVKSQRELQEEILKCLSDRNYFREHRERLRPVFFKYIDTNSIHRTWKVIDEVMSQIS